MDKIIKPIFYLLIIPLLSKDHLSFLLHRLRQLALLVLRNLNNESITLHLRRIKSSKSLVGIFFFLVFVYPFSPIYLNVLIFFFSLDQSWPKSSIRIFLLKYEKHMEASFAPFWLFCVNFFEKFKFEAILFLRALCFKCEMSWREFYFFIDNVHEMDLNEYTIFALSPFSGGVAE